MHFSDGYTSWTLHGENAGGEQTKDNGAIDHVDDARHVDDEHVTGEEEDESKSEDMDEEMEGNETMSEMLDDVRDRVMEDENVKEVEKFEQLVEDLKTPTISQQRRKSTHTLIHLQCIYFFAKHFCYCFGL